MKFSERMSSGWLRASLSVLLTAALVAVVVGNQEALDEIIAAWTPLLFLAVTGALVVQNVAQFLVLPALAYPLGKRFTFLEVMRVGSLSSLFSAIGPLQVGLAYKAAFLKFRKRFHTANIVGLILTQKLLRILICVVGGVWSWACLDPAEKAKLSSFNLPAMDLWISPVATAVTIAAGLGIAAIGTRASESRVKSALASARGFSAELGQGFVEIVRNPSGATAAIALHVLTLMINALTFYLLLDAAGQVVPISLLAAYVCLKYLANVVSVLPANLGVSELLTGGLTMLLGGDLALGVGIALQVRVLNLLLLATASSVLIQFAREDMDRSEAA